MEHFRVCKTKDATARSKEELKYNVRRNKQIKFFFLYGCILFPLLKVIPFSCKFCIRIHF